MKGEDGHDGHRSDRICEPRQYGSNVSARAVLLSERGLRGSAEMVFKGCGSRGCALYGPGGFCRHDPGQSRQSVGKCVCGRLCPGFGGLSLLGRANGEECDTTWLETELGICCYLAFSHDRGKTEYLQRAEEMLKAHYPIEDMEARMYLAFALHDKAHLKFGLDNKDASLRLSLLTDCAKHRSELVHGDIACYYLGEAYLDGIGCQRDDDKAYQWMSLAQEMGFNCQVILRRFKKRLFGGYVFQG